MCCLEVLHREAQAGGSVHFVRNYFWGMILKSAGNMGDGERWRGLLSDDVAKIRGNGGKTVAGYGCR